MLVDAINICLLDKEEQLRRTSSSFNYYEHLLIVDIIEQARKVLNYGKFCLIQPELFKTKRDKLTDELLRLQKDKINALLYENATEGFEAAIDNACYLPNGFEAAIACIVKDHHLQQRLGQKRLRKNAAWGMAVNEDHPEDEKIKEHQP